MCPRKHLSTSPHKTTLFGPGPFSAELTLFLGFLKSHYICQDTQGFARVTKNPKSLVV